MAATSAQARQAKRGLLEQKIQTELKIISGAEQMKKARRWRDAGRLTRRQIADDKAGRKRADQMLEIADNNLRSYRAVRMRASPRVWTACRSCWRWAPS